MAAATILENRKNRHISAVIGPILTMWMVIGYW